MATPLFVTGILGKGQSWSDADSANTKKDLTAVASGNGMLVAAAFCVSTDTANKVVQLFLNDGSTDVHIWSIPVPLLSGSDGATAGVNLFGNTTLLPGLASDGSLAIPSGWKLRAAVTATLTSGKTVTVTTNGGSL